MAEIAVVFFLTVAIVLTTVELVIKSICVCVVYGVYNSMTLLKEVNQRKTSFAYFLVLSD